MKQIDITLEIDESLGPPEKLSRKVNELDKKKGTKKEKGISK